MPMKHAFLNKTFSSNNKYITKDLYVKTYSLKEVISTKYGNEQNSKRKFMLHINLKIKHMRFEKRKKKLIDCFSSHLGCNIFIKMS